MLLVGSEEELGRTVGCFDDVGRRRRRREAVSKGKILFHYKK